MRKNKDIILDFLKGDKEIASNTNMSCHDNKLFSYQTCIAEIVGTYLIINRTRYSVSTTKQVNTLRFESMKFFYNELEVENVPLNAKELKSHLKYAL